jgi:hypothetical protein
MIASSAVRALEMVVDQLPHGVTNNPFFKLVVTLLPDIFGEANPTEAWCFAVFGVLDSYVPKRGAFVDWEIIDNEWPAWNKLMQSPGHEYWEDWFRDRGFTFLDRRHWRPDDLASVVEHRAFTCALTHDLFTSSALAIDLVLEALDASAGSSPRLVFDPDGKTVHLDGAPYTIKNPRTYKAFKIIVDADGELVTGLARDVDRPDKLFRPEHLPVPLRLTFEGKAANGGGYRLLPEFSRQNRDRP